MRPRALVAVAVAVTAVTVAATSPLPVGAIPPPPAATPAALPAAAVARQARTPAGSACTSDDDCGGYAVFPALWCRAGAGADTPTCRSFVGIGDACGAADVACPAGTLKENEGSVKCRNGTCTTVFPAAVGERCFLSLPKPCADGATCSSIDRPPGVPFDPTLKCVATGLEGASCGWDSGICGPGWVCGAEVPEGGSAVGPTCPYNLCPGGRRGTCRAWTVGDTCGEGLGFFCGHDNGLTCGPGTSVCVALGGVGDACDAGDDGTARCDEGLACGIPPSASSGDGTKGTCRPPAVGDECNGLNCQAGGEDLVCAAVGATGLDDTPPFGSVLACVVPKAEGDACRPSGVGEVCAVNNLYCVGGVCSTSTAGASRGDECQSDGDCTDGTWCLTPSLTFPLPRRACGLSRVPAGGACNADAATFCDIPAGLTCVGGVCAATDDGSLPGLGAECNINREPACGASVENATAATLVCASLPGNGPRVCVWDRPAGTPCVSNEPSRCASGTRCSGGICRSLSDLRAPRGDTCRRNEDCDPDEPLVCAPPASRPLYPVCVSVVPRGGSCDGELDQCAVADGTRCVAGVCVDKVALGESCDEMSDCSSGECWRGAGATGPTCRAWVGFAARCDNTAVKCWRGLSCGAAGTCENAGARATPAGAFCEADSDCVAADGDTTAYVCVAGRRGDLARRCNRQAAPADRCDAPFTLCPADFPCWPANWWISATCTRWVGWGGGCTAPGERCWVGMACGADGTCGSGGWVGGRCRTDADCPVEGHTCGRPTPGASSWLSCARYVPAGGLCDEADHRCTDGRQCVLRDGEKRCNRWVGPAGAACAAAGDRCWTGLACVAGTCGTGGGRLGDFCATDAECPLPGHTCGRTTMSMDGSLSPRATCARFIPPGGVCGGGADARCADGRLCLEGAGGVCSRWVGPAGTACDGPGDRCWTGLSCVGGVCVA